jgi:hypothetical protein
MPDRIEPRIRVFFTGILALHYDKENASVKVGVNRCAEGHKLSVTIFEKPHIIDDEGKPVLDENGSPVYSEHGLPIYLPDCISEQNIFLNVDFKTPPVLEPIRLYPDNTLRGEPKDAQDIRWGVVLDGEKFQDKPLRVRPGTMTPSFNLNAGEFYTVIRRAVTKIYPDGHEDPAAIAAALIAADIDFDATPEQDEAYLTYYASGQKNEFIFESHAKYEIYVSVLPVLTASEHGHSTNQHAANHFQYHYWALDDLFPGQRFDINPGPIHRSTSKKSHGRQVTYIEPCIPIILEQSPF